MARNDYADRVVHAVQDIAAGLDRALDLTALAKAAALSPLHFHRIFRGLVGETPLELHRRLRLERAAWALLESDAPVTRIAFDAGYETHESFTRAFRARYDASPSELRAELRQKHVAWAAPTAIGGGAPSGVHFTPNGAMPVPVLAQGGTAQDVTLVQLSDKRVLAVVHRGPYGKISDAFVRLDGIVRASRLRAEDVRELVALYHDDPEQTPAAELRAEAGIVTSPDVPVPDGLVEVIIPAGLYARVLHVGPYTELGDAWARLLGRWLAPSGYRFGAGPMYERYLNTPAQAAPSELRTELYLSLAEPGGVKSEGCQT